MGGPDVDVDEQRKRKGQEADKCEEETIHQESRKRDPERSTLCMGWGWGMTGGRRFFLGFYLPPCGLQGCNWPMISNLMLYFQLTSDTNQEMSHRNSG